MIEAEARQSLGYTLPEIDLIRSRIESVKQKNIQMCLKTIYLYAGRISEVVGVNAPSSDPARGPTGKDVRLDEYKGHPVTLFTVRTCKREGLERIIALPLDYELWASQVADYFSEFKPDEPVFAFRRQNVWYYTKHHKVFEGLTYPIEAYRIKHRNKLAINRSRHSRPYNLHAIRHSRASELVKFYGFDGFNLAVYCGWAFGRVAGTTSIMNRYLSLDWHSYFDKLLKSR